MSDKPANYRISLAAIVDEILWREWDPIQVNEFEGAIFEYEGYVSRVVSRLRRGGNVDEVAELLDSIASKSMNVGAHKLERGHHLRVAKILCEERDRFDLAEIRHKHTPPPNWALRLEVWLANKALPDNGLVTMHSGNASGYDPDSDALYIKPSGVDYNAIGPEDLVAVRVSDGTVLTEGTRPSVDLPHHLFLYRNMPEIRGVIHTHSNYATAFAAVGKAIPLCLTAICDEFGAEIPCMPYVGNEDDEIGRSILKHRNRAPAILLGNHGVFAWGNSPKSALKAAVMTEDVAKTVWLAMQIGEPKAIPTEEAEKWYDRYHNRYGQ